MNKPISYIELAKKWETIEDEDLLRFKTWFNEQTGRMVQDPAELRMACKAWDLGKVVDVCLYQPKRRHFVLIENEDGVEEVLITTMPCEACDQREQ